MCGIVGYIGNGTRTAVPFVLAGLQRLEYRGYDSAGVAVQLSPGKIAIEKSEGRLTNTSALLQDKGAFYSQARFAMGHTRWATHGKPTTQNAHPHRTGHVVLVHNGIIENYQEIKAEILSQGHKPKSETDSELFGFLVLNEMNAGLGLVDAVRKSFSRLKGQCSVVVMSEAEPDLLVGVRRGSPLVAAIDPQGGMALASDAQPLLELGREVYFLEHGEMAVGSAKNKSWLTLLRLDDGASIQRDPVKLDWSLDRLDKQGFEHFMLKEIFEQPVSLVDTLNGILDRARADAFPLAEQPGVKLLDHAREIVIVACGTSWHAALIAKYWFEKWALMRTRVELASEFRYSSPVVDPSTLLIAMSQSGETADILACVKLMRDRGVPTLGVTNVRGCSLSREAQATFFMSAGPEIGVAATKTFSAQLMLLFLLAGYVARKKTDQSDVIDALFQDVVKIPHLLAGVLAPDSAWVGHARRVATLTQHSKGFFFIGRGLSFPIALEGALKLKEIAYVHAEGYAAGELKHGPIAMIDEEVTVIVFAPKDHWREKTVSNLEEVKARGGRVVGVGDPGDTALQALCDFFIPLPQELAAMHETLYPFTLTPVLQLYSYELACLKGTDVDKPRNLAKSVTVE